MALADILFMSDLDVTPLPLVVGAIVKAKDPYAVLLQIPAQYIEYTQERFGHAVVVSVAPLVLVSENANIRWSLNIDITEFKVIGMAKPDAVVVCMTRLLA